MQTAFSGMSAATTILDVVANNLANYETRGFKAGTVQLATSTPLLSSLGSPNSNPIELGAGVHVIGVDSDLSQGSIQINDQPPLLALDGDGLFILHSRSGTRLFTRDGQFHWDADGQLVTADGDQVLGFGLTEDGKIDHRLLKPIVIRLGASALGTDGASSILRSYSIDRNGQIISRFSDGVSRPLGQLRLARFANPAGLHARGLNKYASTPASGLPHESNPGEDGAAHVISGASEFSNTDIGRQLIELALAGTLFQTNLTVLQTADDMLGSMFFPWRVRS
jgi:flagellar basal-body rod protein FlgG